MRKNSLSPVFVAITLLAVTAAHDSPTVQPSGGHEWQREYGEEYGASNGHAVEREKRQLNAEDGTP